MEFKVNCQLSKVKCEIQGFSLLELLIVVGIVAVISVAGVASYRSFGKNVQIGGIARTMIADIRQAQANAMIGKNGYKWGVHIVNSNDDYYEIFSTPDVYANASTTVMSTTTLSSGISFSDPASGNSKDIIFSKISGTTTATSTTLISENLIKTINISAIGTIGE
jgi:prepilin-type N-terminal cleavage/methylation domain-containing protein